MRETEYRKRVRVIQTNNNPEKIWNVHYNYCMLLSVKY